MRSRLLTLAVLPVALGPVGACGTPPGQAGPTPSEVRGAPSGGGSTTPAAPATPTTSPTPAPPSCADLVAKMSVEDRVGQLFMVGKSNTSAVDPGFRSMLAETRTGQVILLENTTAGRTGVKKLSDDVRGSAVAPRNVRVLVAADQEGGLVQRLKGSGFTTIPSAVEQAAMGDAELEKAAETWARELKQAGIDVDLAPVTDVVPPEVGSANEPIGKLRRGYGMAPGEVAPKTNAFIKGMAAAGLATSVKHFPNLGRVKGNTDLQANVTDATTTRTDAALAPFREGIDAGADMVMVSTAIYSKIDPGVPATFSKVVVGEMIRRDLGFEGVVISDDMGAAKQVASVAPGDRAVRFIAAGGDVVINGDPSLQPAMVQAVRTRAADDPAFADQVRRSAERVVAYKAKHGAAECGK